MLQRTISKAKLPMFKQTIGKHTPQSLLCTPTVQAQYKSFGTRSAGNVGRLDELGEPRFLENV